MGIMLSSLLRPMLRIYIINPRDEIWPLEPSEKKTMGFLDCVSSSSYRALIIVQDVLLCVIFLQGEGGLE